MRDRRALVIVAALAGGCGDNIRGAVTIASATWIDPLRELAAATSYDGLAVVAVTAPDAELARVDDEAFRIVIVADATLPAEGYRIDLVAGHVRTWSVRAPDVLGAQYGATAALEHLGFRFRHPLDVFRADVLGPGDDALGVVHAPTVRVRGLQLHTLHPVEGYYALWDPPSGGGIDDARRIIDWTIKNRGNYLQWVALADIVDPTRHAAWAAHTRAVLDYAHARGVRVGLNVELFGASNIQRAFDLVESATVPVADQVAAKLPLVVTDLPFDVYDLSFGEFFDADPSAFIAALDEATRQLHALAPAAEVHAVVHVGATQRVTYMGKDLLYYFLVKYADPSIVPELHTVMYYDLFEDAGGAYHHADFAEHRQYLVDRMCAHAPAAYFPETAYWIAFDDSVPQFLPLYVRSRWLDLAQLPVAAPPPCGALDEHLIFSSGWEWGYWLHDATALRASYELPATPRDAIADQLAIDLGGAAVTAIADLAEVQHDALIGARLAPYLASRDAVIDAGRQLGVVSQPDRMTFADLVAATADARAGFATTVLDPLASYGAQLDAIGARVDALALPDSRWARELRDGIAIDRARARFVLASYRATLAHLAGDDTSASRERADAAAALDAAQAIVHDRHADLHDPHGDRLIAHSANATVYDFAYLYMADVLCYWRRELVQVDAVVVNSSTVAPSCIL